MLLVNMAFVSIVSAKEVVNAAENTKDGNVGIRVLVLSVPIYGDLSNLRNRYIQLYYTLGTKLG
ncbi:hypothetical protein [Methanosarcina barkeri]|uniref:hypothetical protein n=1 Tax=Methanosarcina barkeri TaxID=2208 RepID=UPI00064EE2D1|nr:hypothetical protein [Methanosarcina barkeri]